MKSMREFYEAYWKHRKKINKIHTSEEVGIPLRLYKALELIDLKNNLKILDIGCGEGAMGKIIKEKNKTIYSIGIDISEKALKLAKEYYDNVKLFNLDEDDFPLEWKKTFNYVIAIEVIEHLFKPKQALLKIKELIKADGRLVVSFPNMAWWKYRIQMLKGYYPEESRSFDMVEHLQNFTLHSFKKLVEETGFRIIKINPDYGKFPGILNYLPWRITRKLLYRFPNLFGYQIVLLLKKSVDE